MNRSKFPVQVKINKTTERTGEESNVLDSLVSRGLKVRGGGSLLKTLKFPVRALSIQYHSANIKVVRSNH